MTPFQPLQRQIFCCCPRVMGFLGNLLQVQFPWCWLDFWLSEPEGQRPRVPERPRCARQPLQGKHEPLQEATLPAIHPWLLDFPVQLVRSALRMTPQKACICFRPGCVIFLVQTQDADSFQGSVICPQKGPSVDCFTSDRLRGAWKPHQGNFAWEGLLKQLTDFEGEISRQA